ncbi:MAG TPA: membrane dipeptidase [Thermomicrobiales bacterium]|nr:membrane dipeptidase [Thermomicrobiales bacterium]
MLLVDAHLDLAMNALVWNRDLKLSAHETRALEAGMTEKGRAAGTVGLPDMHRGQIGLCCATVLGRVNPQGSAAIDFRTHEIAYAHCQGELALYREFQRQGLMSFIRNQEDLERHLKNWLGDTPDNDGDRPIGIILLMEGADPIVEPDRAAQWWDDGLRIVGLAHYGPSAYAFGTDSAGPLTAKGRELCKMMDELGMILDVSHLTDESFHDALDRFHGPVMASHSNCRALVDGDRQMSDEMIRRVLERGAVIGVAADAWMLEPGWVRGVTRPDRVTMQAMADHIDHICQLAGNTNHVGIGSDLDGGYGTEQTPNDLDTIDDLQKLTGILEDRGYTRDDLARITHGNWVGFFRQHLPGA